MSYGFDQYLQNLSTIDDSLLMVSLTFFSGAVFSLVAVTSLVLLGVGFCKL